MDITTQERALLDALCRNEQADVQHLLGQTHTLEDLSVLRGAVLFADRSYAPEMQASPDKDSGVVRVDSQMLREVLERADRPQEQDRFAASLEPETRQGIHRLLVALLSLLDVGIVRQAVHEASPSQQD